MARRLTDLTCDGYPTRNLKHALLVGRSCLDAIAGSRHVSLASLVFLLASAEDESSPEFSAGWEKRFDKPFAALLRSCRLFEQLPTLRSVTVHLNGQGTSHELAAEPSVFERGAKWERAATAPAAGAAAGAAAGTPGDASEKEN